MTLNNFTKWNTEINLTLKLKTRTKGKLCYIDQDSRQPQIKSLSSYVSAYHKSELREDPMILNTYTEGFITKPQAPLSSDMIE